MSKKIYFFGFSTLLLVIALLNVSLTFGQIYWEYCKVSAYGTNVIEEEIGTIERTIFNVAVPPLGSEITNTVEVINYDSGEHYTMDLPIGANVIIRYDFIAPDINIVEPAAESGHFNIYYEGAVERVRINGIDVPEFSPILIAPMFMIATLLALIYRRKRMK
jgi:hypothetical protein